MTTLPTSWAVYNNLGALITTSEFTNGTDILRARINVANWVPCLYFVVVQSGDYFERRKVILK